MATIKVSSDVDEDLYREVAAIARAENSTVRNVVKVALALGMEALNAMPGKRRAKLIPPDGRRRSQV